MIIRPNTLSIVTTHQCTAACANCCFGCTPKHTKRIPTPAIHNYIEQATKIPSFKVVVFTGGECFLLGKDLDFLVAKASEGGLVTRFVSNGYWATSKEIARRRLKELTDAGLHEANLSTGDNHAKFVPPDRVKIAAIEAVNAGLTALVMVELFQTSEFNFKKFLGDGEFKELVASGHIGLRLSPWMSFSENDVPQSAKYSQLSKSANGRCSTIFDVVTINPDQILIACCGLPFEDLKDLHLGDLRNTSIKDLLDMPSDDFLKVWLHIEGPEKIVQYASKYDESISIPKNKAHICDICRLMYKDKKILSAIRKYPPPHKSEIIDAYNSRLLITSIENRNYKPLFKRHMFDGEKQIAEANRVYELATS